MTTPNLDLPTLPNGSVNTSLGFNDAMQTIDTFLPLIVQSLTVTTPPTTVSGDVGKRWIIPAGASGVWAGKTGEIALCTAAGVWAYLTAPQYILAFDLNTSAEYQFLPAGWQLFREVAGSLSSVLSRSVTAPPGSPGETDAYIVPAGATGDWASHVGKIATYWYGAWVYSTPQPGWLSFIQSETKLSAYYSGAWSAGISI